MKKLLFILSLFVCIQVSGQYPGIVAASQRSGTSKAVYTDDFEAYSEGGLAGQGNWVAGLLDMTIVDNAGNNYITSGATSGNTAIVKYNATFANDQYSQIELLNDGSGYRTVGVRFTGSGATLDGYTFTVAPATGNIYLDRYDNGSSTQLATASGITMVAGDVIKLSVSGTELSVFLNGSLITALSGDGKVTDATYASGVATIGAYSDITGCWVDNWEGGDL